ncbi:LysR family transcriptional regulator [Maritimibacter sp. 55A14]|uniref:LysR substrate-binding domain-containing protein n=1 Tax=Maritimibacter sp. 55A14 TaxID=2174844 RepID=UPI000D60E714|nr:LysR substrate-binding domain-containing protein [Maritimibacter sp. 55A14]PWE29387.1 LysR family transcriptional regulator [Maritimibacter sp. 55A14]
MRRKLPPFPALRAFEAAARLGSFKDAAEELCVTPSAISHQVRTLEEFLGRTLFLRGGNRLELAQDGRVYLAQVGPLLDRLDASTRMVAGEVCAGPLRLKMTEGFLNRWLMPRLHRFVAQYPEVEIAVETGLPPTDFRGGALDVVIHWGDAPVPGVRVEPFMSSTRSPVCSPAYLEANPDLTRPDALLDKVLIRDEVADGWAEWFALTDAAGRCPEGGPVFAHCELTMSAAENGLGVALGYLGMIGESLRKGDLVAPFALESASRTIYSIACEETRADDPRIVAFRGWLLDEVLADGPPASERLRAAE